ncbi:MAG: hypothetical protein O6926_00240, partial [candidate division NC10 bacterium]|nr:hypothetical protein [candidate division NC10 bacterium]
CQAATFLVTHDGSTEDIRPSSVEGLAGVRKPKKKKEQHLHAPRSRPLHRRSSQEGFGEWVFPGGTIPQVGVA